METTQKIPMKKGSSSYKIIIPNKVEKLIRFLCERVWDTEWSGVLFYTPSGNFEDGSLEIRCEDILPMDIGSTTYTEFNMSPDVISYMAQHPELLDYKMGLIHSHNNMSTFFSGTDLSTLQEEGNERNHFVSLIVNNAGKYTAAITRKIKYTSVRSFSYEGFNGTVSDGHQETIDGEELEYFNLDIVFEEPEENPFGEVADRLSEIKKAKQEAVKTTTNLYTPDSYTSKYWGKDYQLHKQDVQPTLFNDDDWDYPGKSWGAPVVQSTKPESKLSELVDRIIPQLITGNVTYTRGDNNYMKKALESMEKRFDARFGTGHEGMLLFEYWATDFIEFLTWYSIDETIDGAPTSEELVKALSEKLGALPVKNDYIDKYIELLTSYVDKF